MRVFRGGRQFEFNMTLKRLHALEKDHDHWWEACDGMTDSEAESYLRGLAAPHLGTPIGWVREVDNVIRLVYK